MMMATDNPDIIRKEAYLMQPTRLSVIDENIGQELG
jgi:hypothetical protein